MGRELIALIAGPYCFADPVPTYRMDDRDRNLADATAELSETLEALRAELCGPNRGPLGLPRPPSPSKLLRFTERYTIPAVIGILEASIRTLELLAALLRVADGRPLDDVSERSDPDSIDALGRAGRDRIARTSRKTLRRLDDALADLQSAVAAEPSNPELQRLLKEARELRADVDDRLAAAVDPSDPTENVANDNVDRKETVEIGVRSVDVNGEDDADGDDGVGIEVDEELASIKEELDTERPSSPEIDGSDGDSEGQNDGERPGDDEQSS